MISYAQACRDKNLFRDWFPPETFGTWAVLDKALFGEALTKTELAVFQQLTGRGEAPTEPAREAWFVMGRRSSKSIKAASIAAYLATVGNERFGFSKRLKPGEVGVAQIMATDKETAAVTFGYLKAMFQKPLLAQLVARETAESLELKNGLAVEVIAATARRSRGRTTFAVILEEVAHWLGTDRSVLPDVEIFNAVQPGLLSMGPNAMVIGISSPLARSGLLYGKHEKHFGQPGRTLVVQAPSWVMNPTVKKDDPDSLIFKAFEEDPTKASAEYGAEFRSELNRLLDFEVIQAATPKGLFERPPERGIRYVAFVDVSGGRRDASTLGIAHFDYATNSAVLDVLRVVPSPHEPTDAIATFAKTLGVYGLSEVHGDNYAAGFTTKAFEDNGISYIASPFTRSEIYLEALPLLNSRRAVILDNAPLIKELAGLERRAAGRGRDSVDHGKAKGSRDDRANSACGALVLAATGERGLAPDDPGVIRIGIARGGFRIMGDPKAALAALAAPSPIQLPPLTPDEIARFTVS